MSSYMDAINQANTSSTGTGTASTIGDAVMGKQDFLMLLVAQLQNQDPLNPDEPTEFTAQLAQFSSLEQLFTLNEGMENMVTSNSNSDRLSTLNTIGKEVAYFDSSFNYSGDPVEIGYQLDNDAAKVTMTLTCDGKTVATIKGEELEPGNHYFTWDGVLENDEQAPLGDYEISLTATAVTDSSVGVAPLIKSEVTGVDLNANYGGILITKAGAVLFNTILGVYEPADPALQTTTGDET